MNEPASSLVNHSRKGRAFTDIPSSDEATWLAPQQSHMQFGFSDNFSFNQQHPHEGASGGSILNQNDNSLLGDFFSNPDITNQMDFNFSTAYDGGGGGDAKASTGEGLFDLDAQSGTINDPASAFGTQHLNFPAEFQTHAHSSDNSQQPSMDNQMSGLYEDREESGEAPGEEEAKVAEGLMGMSTNHSNRPNPSQMMFGNRMDGPGGEQTWGNFSMNAPFFGMQNTPVPIPAGKRSAGPRGQFTFDGQTADDSLGYNFPHNMPSQHQAEYFSMGMHMHGQSHANQPRVRPRSIPNIQTAGAMHVPDTAPRSAQLPHAAYPNYLNNNSRSAVNVPRADFGTDESFKASGFRPPSAYDPTREKSANLNQVPLAQEASANSRSRQSSNMDPRARIFQPEAPPQQPQDYFSAASQPSTPALFNNMPQEFFGGLQTTQNGGKDMAPALSSYGGMPITPFHAHGNAHPPGQYYQNSQFRTINKRPAHGSEDEKSAGSSSENEDSETETPLPVSKPARKRRKSTYELQGEDEYQPPSGDKRGVKSTLDDSSDEDEYGPDSSTGKKGARSHTAHRNSITSSRSTPSTPAVRTPRPTSSASGGKRSSRKRQSGSHIARAPLSDEQRRQNHIKSEKNRRDLIKTNYTELNNLIPALKNGKSGLSKAEVLKEIVEFIEELEAGNAHMQQVLDSYEGEYDDAFPSDDDEDEDGASGGAAGGLNSVEAC